MKRGQVENTYAKKCHVARYKENFSNTIKMIDHWIRFSIDHSWNKLGKKSTEDFYPPVANSIKSLEIHFLQNVIMQNIMWSDLK